MNPGGDSIKVFFKRIQYLFNKLKIILKEGMLFPFELKFLIL